VQTDATPREVVRNVVHRCGVTAFPCSANSLSSVQCGAIRNVLDARRSAPFSAPDGTTVGTTESPCPSVPVALIATASILGTFVSTLGNRLTAPATSNTATFVYRSSVSVIVECRAKCH